MKTTNETYQYIVIKQKEIDKYWKRKDLQENIEICDEKIMTLLNDLREWKKIKKSFIKELNKIENPQI